ncbi:MAG TPA: Lrp/AsnC family transcriptional regulator [Candidatus Wallbacteria bacterium]|nr:Lrp/AsnC family transcriptional regulator [Candidatus Wallbacteria bacterium]
MLTELDIKILELIQNEVPLCERPFEVIASRLCAAGMNISEEETIERIKSLYLKKYIRRIGPIFDAAALGYKSALAAVKVSPADIEKAAGLISSYKSVTHNYIRDDDSYNVWFTVTEESEKKIIETLEEIKTKLAIGDYLFLPSEKTYKIKVGFDLKAGYGGTCEK